MLSAAAIPEQPSQRVYATKTDRNRAQRARDKERGIKRGKGNTYQQSKSRFDREYLERPIFAWDGEGVSRTTGEHDYVLFASSEGDRIVAEHGLHTRDILSTICDRAAECPKALNVIYGGGYDFNSWLIDVPKELVQSLVNDEYVNFAEFTLLWRAGRFMRIKRGAQCVTVYDVVPFFQCSFVKACDEYLGPKFVDRDNIVASKAKRGTFSFDEITAICEYNDSELVNLVELVKELRYRLWKVDIKPSQWYGPGAIAAALLGREGVANHRLLHDKISHQERVAYSGGRFEVFKHGYFMGRTYQYDINSAYPSALRHVPSLIGSWTRRRKIPETFPEFSLVHASWNIDIGDRPGPLWVRRPNGVIYSPPSGSGWYWGIEINAAIEYAALYKEAIHVDEWYKFRPDDAAARPFAFIVPMYNKRRALKLAKDGAHVGLKLGLNSLYGKLAQQIGWRIQDGDLRLPPYHTLSWAGFTTAHCRANILRAITLDPDAVIATETDAVFTRRPLKLAVGSALGEWEATEWKDLVYIQSGFYAGESRAMKGGKGIGEFKSVVKSRGIDKGFVTYEDIRHASDTGTPIASQLTRYVGARLALAQNWQRWRTWETITKNIKPEPQGKRLSVGFTMAGETFTRTIVPFEGMESSPYPVEWIDQDEDTEYLNQMKMEMYDDDWEV